MTADGILQTLLTFGPLLVALWFAQGLYLASWSAWKGLRQIYPFEPGFEADDSFLCSRYGFFDEDTPAWRSGHFNPGLHVPFLLLSVNSRFVCLNIPPAPFFRPILIPWNDVHVEMLGGQLLGWVQFQFSECPKTRLLLPEEVARKFAAAAKQELPKSRQSF